MEAIGSVVGVGMGVGVGIGASSNRDEHVRCPFSTIEACAKCVTIMWIYRVNLFAPILIGNLIIKPRYNRPQV